MNIRFDPKRAREQRMTEGKTYLARMVKCPTAYRKIKGHKSTRGKIVRVTLGRVVNIEWEGGGENSVDRSRIRILGEVP